MHARGILIGVAAISCTVAAYAMGIQATASSASTTPRADLKNVSESVPSEDCEPNYFGVPPEVVERQSETCPDGENAYVRLLRATRSEVLEARMLAALCSSTPEAEAHKQDAEALWVDFQVNLHMKLATSLFEIDLDKRNPARSSRTEDETWWQLYHALVERQGMYLERLDLLRADVFESLGIGGDQLSQNEDFLDRVAPPQLKK